MPPVQPSVARASPTSRRTPGRAARAASALTTALLLTVLAGPSFGQAGGATASCPALLDHRFQRLQGGQTESLCDYGGKVVLVVNTASYCGYTHQYEGLEALYRKYKDRGLVVVGFPSNDFGGQEPGTSQEIAEFCRTTYGVQFPMYEKTSVSGVADNPLYTELAARTGERPRWNFHKYLIDRRGVKVTSFRSAVEPDSREFVRAIEQMLAEPASAGRG
ncbi:MAG TPA: glutathione peroxidase [Casimicrobiaceae bacterium]|nr:glutathione peroxidase [Casimicrobiaceae bacterium]